MKISKVVLACHRKDLWLTKIAVASIRYWYPDIKILVYKDLFSGNFDTHELEKYWKVEVNSQKMRVGSPLAKLKIITTKPAERIMLIDSDVVFAGKVIDYLNGFAEDVVVSAETLETCETEWFYRTYYDCEKLKAFDPAFVFPGYSFNTGQYVVTTGVVSDNDLTPYVDFTGKAKLKHPNIFSLHDQGLLNYLLVKKEQLGEITIAKPDFMVWMSSRTQVSVSSTITVENIKKKLDYPAVVHWAGTVHPDITKMPGAALVDFFQSYYYSALPFGAIRRWFFNAYRKVRYSLYINWIKKTRQHNLNS